MTKPIKPNITIPEAFAVNGQKADFLDEKIQNGFSNVDPDVLAGDNLNKLIDDTYKGLNYSMDGVSDLYKSVITYDSAETYGLNSIVFNIEEEGVALYQSLIADNTGNALTDETKWKKLELGGGGWGSISGNISEQTDLQQALTAKLNSDFSNSQKPYITETYVNGASWYRVWSDGWCEQGGRIVNGSAANTTINFLKTMKNTNYCAQVTLWGTSDGYSQGAVARYFTVWNFTQNSMITNRSSSSAIQQMWRVEGYLAEGQY